MSAPCHSRLSWHMCASMLNHRASAAQIALDFLLESLLNCCTLLAAPLGLSVPSITCAYLRGALWLAGQGIRCGACCRWPSQSALQQVQPSRRLARQLKGSRQRGISCCCTPGAACPFTLALATSAMSLSGLRPLRTWMGRSVGSYLLRRQVCQLLFFLQHPCLAMWD